MKLRGLGYSARIYRRAGAFHIYYLLLTTHSFSLLPPLAARFSYSLPPASALLVLFRCVLGQRLWLKSEKVFPLSVSLVRK